MWQPTPSWSQPDPNQSTDAQSDAQPVEEIEETADALSEDLPGDSWSGPATKPVDQPAPWAQPQPSAPTPSWTQPAADRKSVV